MRPYSVTERIKSQTPNGDQWDDITAYVVVDQAGREVTDLSDTHAVASRWCEWLNDAFSFGESAGREAVA